MKLSRQTTKQTNKQQEEEVRQNKEKRMDTFTEWKDNDDTLMRNSSKNRKNKAHLHPCTSTHKQSHQHK